MVCVRCLKVRENASQPSNMLFRIIRSTLSCSYALINHLALPIVPLAVCYGTRIRVLLGSNSCPVPRTFDVFSWLWLPSGEHHHRELTRSEIRDQGWAAAVDTDAQDGFYSYTLTLRTILSLRIYNTLVSFVCLSIALRAVFVLAADYSLHL